MFSEVLDIISSCVDVCVARIEKGWMEDESSEVQVAR